MASKINEVITGEYDHTGKAIIYGDTDSVAYDSIIRTDQGDRTIEELFMAGDVFWQQDDKEYSRNDSIKVASYDSLDKSTKLSNYLYVYRHKVRKKKYRITTSNGKTVDVTEDHSVMVLEEGQLVEKKPMDLSEHDTIIALSNLMSSQFSNITQVQDMGDFEDEYVYDIGIHADHPYFFANDVLVHNSAYFSAYPVMKDLEDFKDFGWAKEDVTQLYDQIADITNDSFADFMEKNFHVPPARCVIKAGRELVASKGMFITKKRYAVLIYDKEGKRKDLDGKPGEIKAMGLDLKRSDTPKPVQDFLSQVLTMVLTDATKDQVFAYIKQFREEFSSWPSWAKGTPKRVNNLSYYGDLMMKQEGGGGDVFDARVKNTKTIPGHVRAALNYNRLRKIYNDHSSLSIDDGSKIVVCKLRQNPLGFNSIAFPVDQLILPDWFKELPFADDEMAEALISKKLDNLLGVLGWDLNESKKNETFDDMFSF